MVDEMQFNWDRKAVYYSIVHWTGNRMDDAYATDGSYLSPFEAANILLQSLDVDPEGTIEELIEWSDYPKRAARFFSTVSMPELEQMIEDQVYLSDIFGT